MVCVAEATKRPYLEILDITYYLRHVLALVSRLVLMNFVALSFGRHQRAACKSVPAHHLWLVGQPCLPDWQRLFPIAISIPSTHLISSWQKQER